ncbi:MAG: HD domain-containing protein [Acidobacteria bacterium]|nr:HD domain-containing protein [Acidobacteriota bacterium]
MTSPSSPVPVAVLDMGASAIRLIIGEAGPKGLVRVLEDASRGVLLGRDAFSTGVIRSETADAALSALEGFRTLLGDYGVERVRAVATSAVREARNGDVFLDRVKARTGLVFEVINEAEESRLVYLAVRDRLAKHGAFKGAWTLLAEVGGGNTDLTLLRRGRPNRSGVYALGAIRLRQQLGLSRHTPDLRASMLNRYIAHIVDEIRVDIPLHRVTHVVAIGGDVRFAAVHVLDRDFTDGAPLDVPRDRFLASLVVCDASLRLGALIDLAVPGGRLGAEDFERQVLASADAVGQKYKYDRAHGMHVARLAVQLFDQLGEEHGLTPRDRLLLEVAALLHDVGLFIGLRGHHRHSQYVLSASQIFGLSDIETQIVANVARYHRRGLPDKSHQAYMALDREDRIIVGKLAAILRVANGLDAEHLQKVRSVTLTRRDHTWLLDLESTGDTTLERLASTARTDLFVETFGRRLLVQERGVAG